MKVIIVSGTPAAGKKTLSQWLSKKLKFEFLDIKPIVKKASEKYDRKKQCYVVDVKKMNQDIIKLIKEKKKNKTSGLIIASHLIHHFPKRYVDLCLIIKCSNLKKLEQRLLKRKYSRKKVMENLQCEIFDICLEEAKKKKHKLLAIDTSKRINKTEVVNKLRN